MRALWDLIHNKVYKTYRNLSPCWPYRRWFCFVLGSLWSYVIWSVSFCWVLCLRRMWGVKGPGFFECCTVEVVVLCYISALVVVPDGGYVPGESRPCHRFHSLPDTSCGLFLWLQSHLHRVDAMIGPQSILADGAKPCHRPVLGPSRWDSLSRLPVCGWLRH